MHMQRCHDTSAQQADSELNTAPVSLVHTAMVPVGTDTNTPQGSQGFTGLGYKTLEGFTAALD